MRTKTDSENEDLSVSMPEGFAPRPSADDPQCPGVRLSELRHGRGPAANGRGQDPGWLKWSVIGLLVLLLIPVAVWAFGVWGVLILIGLGVVGLLVGIFVRLGKR